MSQPKLYFFIGAPGAGKTTIAQAIAEASGAKHIWADVERHKLFKQPTHSREESDQLYQQLNDAAEYLLSRGKSVVYDTNFNFYADRQLMREMAARHDAEPVLIWVTTPLDVARRRAVTTGEVRNGYEFSMTAAEFEAIAAKLQPPRPDEKIIKIDGAKLDTAGVLKLLDL